MVLDPGAEVRFGELLYIQRDDLRGFAARVVEAHEENAFADPGRIHRAQAFELEVPFRGDDRSPEVVRTATAEVLEDDATISYRHSYRAGCI